MRRLRRVLATSLDQDDVLDRLPNIRFDQMLRNPPSYRLQRFAGTRVRVTDFGVALGDRPAVEIVRITFNLPNFDATANFLLECGAHLVP